MYRTTAIAVFLMFSPALAATPEQAWRASLKDDNADWATAKHAILKINDAAYIHSGETVSLVGDPAKPESWHWARGLQKGASLVAGFSSGRAQLTKGGKKVPAEALAKGIDIVPGIDVAGAPTQMAPNETGLRIMVFNQQHKAAKAFKGVDYFAYDPAFRVSATFKPDRSMAPHVFRTSRGLDKQFFHAGDAAFTLRGTPVTLPFYAEDNVPSKIARLSAFFADRLTGKETYGAGRYVDVEAFGKFPPKIVTIDFNYAYNPNCARSPFYNCPVAIDEIPLAVRSGERDPHAH